MSKFILVDTSILISFYNFGRFSNELLNLNQTSQVIFSVVTINEFIRGAHSRVAKNIVSEFLQIVETNLVTPTQNQWIECGVLSEKILNNKKRSKESIVLLQNDILIALNAHYLKATLITSDKKDFELIRNFVPLQVEFW